MTNQEVDAWNECFPVGSPCMVRYDDGTEHMHHTRSQAWRLSAGHTVVQVTGKTGGWSLDRLKMIETHNPKETA